MNGSSAGLHRDKPQPSESASSLEDLQNQFYTDSRSDQHRETPVATAIFQRYQAVRFRTRCRLSAPIQDRRTEFMEQPRRISYGLLCLAPVQVHVHSVHPAPYPLVSMLGNLALMRILVQEAHLPLLVSISIAILCCSIVNFCLGNNWAFAVRTKAIQGQAAVLCRSQSAVRPVEGCKAHG